MRVLQAMAGARHGGAEAFFERLAVALHGTGLAQRLLIRRHPARAERLTAAGLDVVELPFGGPLDWRTGSRFRHEIAGFEPAVVLTWMNRATSFCPRAATGGFVHAARLGGYYSLKYYRRCQHLVCNTGDIADHVVDRGWSRERVHYLPNFVGAERLPAAARAALDTPPDATVLLALGRLHPNKGFDVAIRALAALPACYLWFAGSGPLESRLRAQATAADVAGRVRFLGWRDDVASLLAAADMLVCPSRHEPLGNVVIEAWAHEVPVIACASQGPKALIRDGDTGMVVPIDDHAGLAAAIARVRDDTALAARLVRRGLEAWNADFREDKVVATYLEFFRRIAA